MGPKTGKITKVVIDTNILISELLFKGELSILYLYWKEKLIQPVFSPDTYREFLWVLAYPKFELTEGDIELIVREEVIPRFEVVEIHDAVSGVCSDPDDDKCLSAATAGSAEYLVTEDRKLLDVTSYGNVRVVAPAEFLRRVRKG